jgi:hypothetical protein
VSNNFIAMKTHNALSPQERAVHWGERSERWMKYAEGLRKICGVGISVVLLVRMVEFFSEQGDRSSHISGITLALSILILNLDEKDMSSRMRLGLSFVLVALTWGLQSH